MVKASSLKETMASSDLIKHYDEIIIRAGDRGKFTNDDFHDFHIDPATDTPEFVKKFKQSLREKRGVDRSVIPVTELLATLGCDEYFDPSSSDPPRTADEFEVFHLGQIATTYERRFKTTYLTKPFADDHGNWLFFNSVSRHFESAPAEDEITVRVDESRRFELVVQVEDQDEYYTYRPWTPFLVLKSLLPRLLVDNDSRTSDAPHGRIHMLFQGASIVRFANRFLDAFSQNKDFILVAIFVGEDAKADRYIMFQSPRSDEVCFELETFDFATRNDRVRFALELYNFSSGLRGRTDDKDTKSKMNKLKKLVRNHKRQFDMEPFFARDPAQDLQKCGYEVIPDVFEDESGGVWESLSPTPPHIHTVYRATDKSKTEMIAKQVHEESNELEILKYLRTIQPQSPHIISFIETFTTISGDWIVFPQLQPIRQITWWVKKEQLPAQLVQFSHDLIAGLGYLHQHGVAHLDIKPDNLLYTKEQHHRLQIIDFGLAIRVDSESEEVQGVRGTDGWMAPEIQEGEKDGDAVEFSPIRADRWACGKVVLWLVGTQGGGDLVKFAKRLMDRDPRRRPSLLEWNRVSAGSEEATDDEEQHVAKRRKTESG